MTSKEQEPQQNTRHLAVRGRGFGWSKGGGSTGKADYLYVLGGGPGIIMGHYLTVMKWRSNFRPSKDQIYSTLGLVMFPELSMELFREDLLLRMGNLIGKVVWVDQTTLATARGRFAQSSCSQAYGGGSTERSRNDCLTAGESGGGSFGKFVKQQQQLGRNSGEVRHVVTSIGLDS
ncbi:hypothetical protein M9H77_14191 [Catharanthus roseus]|uniref:Uncharacterized protein n=1 Tax=Catharanthus roseus TaxID=4058 RepID=A0ACC0BML0_CATRO|nr:hypothetical protein M9H77_14191 [Catharanthus roseus]